MRVSFMPFVPVPHYRPGRCTRRRWRRNEISTSVWCPPDSRTILQAFIHIMQDTLVWADTDYLASPTTLLFPRHNHHTSSPHVHAD